MTLVTDFDLFWPTSLEYFYFLHHYLGNVIQTLLPLHCLYTDAFYISIISATLAPFAIVSIFAIFGGVLLLIFKAISCSVTTLRVMFVNIIVVGLAYVYPFIVRMALSVFLCKTIEPGEQWV